MMSGKSLQKYENGRKKKKKSLACIMFCVDGNGLCWTSFWKNRQTELAQHLNTAHYMKRIIINTSVKNDEIN